MIDPIDAGLGKLRVKTLDCDLGRLESDVHRRLEARARGDLFRGLTFPIQVAVTCGALLLGLFIGSHVSHSGIMRSEIAVLSDGVLAPSVRLEGGV